MIRRKEQITIDGVKAGIVVELINSTNPDNITRSYITVPDEDGSRINRLFNNLEVAKITAKLYYPDSDYEFYFQFIESRTNQPIIVSRKLCHHKQPGLYQFIDGDVIYDIKELYIHRITETGYFVFDNGDTSRYEGTDGFEKQQDNIVLIENIASDIIADNWSLDTAIEHIDYHKGECILKVKNTTSRIHILYNTKIMKINQTRKAQGRNMFPFNKNMDKFLTLYVYISKDYSEPIKVNGDVSSTTLIGYIEEDLKKYAEVNNMVEPKYVSTNNKNIKMEGLYD